MVIPAKFILLLLLLSSAIGCKSSTEKDSGQVLILAAASMKDALAEVASEFNNHNQSDIVISTGPSNALAQQVISSGKVDIYISANQRWRDKVLETRPAKKNSGFASNQLVLIVPINSSKKIESLTDLLTDKVSRVVLGSSSVPVGMYADEVLVSLNLFDDLERSNKVVRANDARSALAYVVRDEVEAGIVYQSDAALSDQVKVAAVIDTALHSRIVYHSLLLDGNLKAQEFYNFLQSDTSQSILLNHGFLPVAENISEESK